MRDYYVSLVDGSKLVSLLAGPFATHDEALACVDVAFAEADRLDPRVWFCAVGTCSFERMPWEAPKSGALNDLLIRKHKIPLHAACQN